MRVFDITATSDSTEVHAGESGTLELTVTNKTDRNLNGLIRVVPDDSTHSAWISVHGNSAKNFTPGSTENLTIKFEPGLTTPPGKGKCRIVVADERNSDENYADITLQYEVKEPRVKPKFKILPWILAGCGAIVAIGVAIWIFSGDKKPIIAPDVVILKTTDKAISKIVEFDLNPVVEFLPKSGGVIGTIKSQTPAAGSPMQPKDDLTIFLFDGVKGEDGTFDREVFKKANDKILEQLKRVKRFP